MANQNDGSIIIDTELDNKGFEKGSEKLLNAVKDLTNSIDNMGDNMMRSFEQIVPVLSSIASSVSQLTGTVRSDATQLVGANDEVVSSEQRIAASAQQAAGAISESTGAAQSNVSGLERQINSINNSLEAVSKSAETGFASGSAVLSFDDKINTLEGHLDTAREQLQEFANTKIPTAEYEELSRGIEKTIADIERMRERQITMEDTGVKKNSKAWQTLEYQIQSAQRVLDDYKVELTALESSGQAFVMGSNTDQYSRMSQAVEDAGTAIERNRTLIDAEALAQARLNVQAAQEQVIRAETASQRQAALDGLRNAQQELNDLATSMSNRQATTPNESSISSWQRFGNVIRTAGNAAVQTAANIAKIGAKAAANGVKHLIDRLKSFISTSKSASNHANVLTKTLTSLKTMLKSRIKRMFISSIISNVKEGLQTLAQYDSTFNEAMSNIKNGAKQLTSNLSVSLGTLIQMVEPILTRLLDLASTAVTYFNAFLSMVTGKSTVTVAKKQMDSYADATKDAASATEELKNQVYGFDKLNKRNGNTSDASSKSAADIYETQNVDGLIPKNIAETLTDQLNNMVSSVDWEGVGTKIGEMFNRALAFLATFIKKFDWINLGASLSTLFNNLIKNVDWSNLGVLLTAMWAIPLQLLVGFFENFDGKTLSDGLHSFITGAINACDWVGLSGRLGAALSKFVTDINWKQLGSDIATLFRTALQSLTSFVSKINWKKVGASVADFLINGPDWKGIFEDFGDLIGSLFVGAFDLLGGFLGEVDWGQLAKDIGDWFTELPEKINFAGFGEKFGTLIGNALNGVLTFLMTLFSDYDWSEIIFNIFDGIGKATGKAIEAINWQELLGKLCAALAGMLLQIPGMLAAQFGGIFSAIGSFFESIGLESVGGFFKGMGDALKNVGSWLKQNLVDPVVNWVKNLFGIHSPSTVFADIGKFLIDGMLSGIKSVWGSVTSFFSNSLAGIKSFFNNTWSNIKSSTLTAWSNIKSSTSSTWSSIKSSLSSTWSSIKSTASSTFSGLKSTVLSKWNEIKSNASSAWNGIKSTLSSAWSSLVSTASNKFSAMKSTIQNKGWYGVGQAVCSGIQRGINSGWNWLTNTVSNIANSLLNTAKNALGIHSPSKLFHDVIGLNIAYGIGDGIEDGTPAILDDVTGVTNAIAKEMNAEMPPLEMSENNVLNGLDLVASRLSEIAGTFRAITAMLTSIGGFTMPQIAAGTVVPIKTRIASASESSYGYGLPNDFTENVDEQLDDVLVLLRQLVAIVKSKNLNIDFNALTEMITRQQRSNMRNYGG